MSRFAKFRELFLRLMIIIGFVAVALMPVHKWVSAQDNSESFWIVRSLYTAEYGVNNPKGLAFSSTANTFWVLDGTANISLITMGEDNAGSRNLPAVQDNPSNVAFDNQSDSLFVFNRGKSELVKSKADGNGLPDALAQSTKYDLRALGVKDAHGITFGAGSDHLFILDAGKSEIVSLVPHPALGFDANEAIRSNKVQRISLKNVGTGLLSGLAYNPSNDHLYVVEPAQKKLYELVQDGSVVSTFDLASLGINHPSAMTFAPSGDATDDPNTM